MVQLVEHCCLKSSRPLWFMFVKSITEGVEILCGSVHWANPLGINTPSGRLLLMGEGGFQMDQPITTINQDMNVVGALNSRGVAMATRVLSFWMYLDWWEIVIDMLLNIDEHVFMFYFEIKPCGKVRKSLDRLLQSWNEGVLISNNFFFTFTHFLWQS